MRAAKATGAVAASGGVHQHLLQQHDGAAVGAWEVLLQLHARLPPHVHQEAARLLVAHLPAQQGLSGHRNGLLALCAQQLLPACMLAQDRVRCIRSGKDGLKECYLVDDLGGGSAQQVGDELQLVHHVAAREQRLP